MSTYERLIYFIKLGNSNFKEGTTDRSHKLGGCKTIVCYFILTGIFIPKFAADPYK